MLAGKAFVGGEDYISKHLKSNDYYEKDHEIEGYWYGAACNTFGVKPGSLVTEHDFEALRDNKHAVTGAQLSERQNKTRKELIVNSDGSMSVKEVCNRRNFYDFTLSAPKSFSAMAVTGQDKRVYQWHNAALQKVLKEMERHVAKRIRTKGARQDDVEFTRNFAAAIYQHDANRALEPQLHTHVVVFNITENMGKNYAIEFNEIMKRSKYFTAVYRDELARQAIEAGVDIHIDKYGAPQIKDMSDIADHFSTRTKIIEKLIADCEELAGVELSRSQKKTITFASRGIDLKLFEDLWKQSQYGKVWKKNDYIKNFSSLVRSCSDGGLDEITTETVIKNQIDSLDVEQYARLCSIKEKSLQNEINGARGSIDGEKNLVNAMSAVDYATDKIYERNLVSPDYDIMTAAINFSLGSGFSDGVIQNTVNDKILSGSLLASNGQVASASLAAMEKELMDIVSLTENKSYSIEGFVKSSKLNDEQGKAVDGIVSCRDQFISLVGDAGTGKTFSTSEIVRAFVQDRHKVFMCAPSNGARDVLRADGKKLRNEFNQPDTALPFERALSLQKFLVSKKIWTGLPAGSLIILDEAGLASLKQLHVFVKLAEKKKWKVLFVGDPKQHTAVEAGDAYRLLLQYSSIHQFRLKDIRRQKENALNGKYREAAKDLAAGNMIDGFEKLDASGAIVETKGDLRYEKMADAYMDKLDKGMSCIVVNAMHRENDLAADFIRKKLKERKLLGEARDFDVYRSLGWNIADKQLYHNYQKGMVVAETKGPSAGKSYTVDKYVKGKGIFTYDDDGVLRIFQQKDLKCMDVGEKRRIEVAIGDELMVRTNIKGLDGEFINGEIVRVGAFSQDGRIIDDKKRILNTKAFTYGYASTSHKSQGSTRDAVIIGFDRHSVNVADKKLAYVAGTRGTTEIQVFCESKEGLAEIAARSGDRQLAVEAGIHQAGTKTAPPSPAPPFLKKQLSSLYNSVQEKVFSVGNYIGDVFKKIYSGVRSLENIHFNSPEALAERQRRDFFETVDKRMKEYDLQQDNKQLIQKKELPDERKQRKSGTELEAGR